MPKIYGHKSGYLIEGKKKNRERALIFFTFLMAFLTLYLVLLPGYKKIGLSIFAFIFFLITILGFRTSRLLDKSFKFNFGLKGESSIFFKCSQLPHEYSIFQDVKIPGIRSNVDFVVVGPTGIFSIEVKSHKGNINFDGIKLARDKFSLEGDFLKQTMAETLNIHNYIQNKLQQDIFVQPVLVFSSQYAKLNFNPGLINNVFVLTGNEFIPFLVNQPQILNIEGIAKIENELKNLVSQS